jgi:hypothetical protein
LGSELGTDSCSESDLGIDSELGTDSELGSESESGTDSCSDPPKYPSDSDIP